MTQLVIHKRAIIVIFYDFEPHLVSEFVSVSDLIKLDKYWEYRKKKVNIMFRFLCLMVWYINLRGLSNAKNILEEEVQ